MQSSFREPPPPLWNTRPQRLFPSRGKNIHRSSKYPTIIKYFPQIIIIQTRVQNEDTILTVPPGINSSLPLYPELVDPVPKSSVGAHPDRKHWITALSFVVILQNLNLWSPAYNGGSSSQTTYYYDVSQRHYGLKSLKLRKLCRGCFLKWAHSGSRSL